jgi:predicted transposase YdaD
MAAEYDNMLKYLTEHHGAALASWLLGRPVGARIRLLKNELSLQPIRADWLALYDLEEEILHVEFETDPAKSEVPLPLRMLDYFVRLYRLYRKPVRQVVIVLHQTGVEIPDEFRVGETYHRYRVIKIWEQDPAPLLAQEGLLPLAVLARSGEPDKLLREVAEQIQNVAQLDTRADLTAATFMLGGLRFAAQSFQGGNHGSIINLSVGSRNQRTTWRATRRTTRTASWQVGSIARTTNSPLWAIACESARKN